MVEQSKGCSFCVDVGGSRFPEMIGKCVCDRDGNPKEWSAACIAADREKVDAAVRALWCALRDLGDHGEEALQKAFVAGAAWWQFHANGATMFSSEREEAENEAVRRYGVPLAKESESDR